MLDEGFFELWVSLIQPHKTRYFSHLTNQYLENNAMLNVRILCEHCVRESSDRILSISVQSPILFIGPFFVLLQFRGYSIQVCRISTKAYGIACTIKVTIAAY